MLDIKIEKTTNPKPIPVTGKSISIRNNLYRSYVCDGLYKRKRMA